MKIADRQHVPGGYMVTVEHPAAYTDGSSRFEQVFVRADDVRGKTPEQVRQAVHDAIESDPIGDMLGEAVAAPAQTKAVFEDRMGALYETWQRWKNTRAEAQSRALPAAVVTALTSRENAAWSDYAVAIAVWRTAP